MKKVLKQAGVVHNHKSQDCYILTVRYDIIKEMHSRDIKILIVICTVIFIIVRYSSMFQYFFIGQLVLKICNFCILLC